MNVPPYGLRFIDPLVRSCAYGGFRGLTPKLPNFYENRPFYTYGL